MTTQAFEVQAVTDEELQAAAGGFLSSIAGGFHSGVMTNAIGVELPAASSAPETLGMMLGQKSGLGK